ncbi:hypothetical protein HN954_00550 [bacterium]|jgi:hypothetical protein|nr:hypothetical protein [bacterium]MBT6832359.1 hypothetical protein [bacterium]MBT6995904.1 hypothetical protein [bacterium]MBT7772765.1 hypothetical protein [bacterium]
MNTEEQTQLEQFLLWFTDQEIVPEKTRRDFIAHILELGYLDEKSIEFIDHVMEKLERRTHRAEAYWTEEVTKWSRWIEAEKNPKTSLQEKDLKNAEIEMQRVSEEFVEEFHAAEKEAMDQEESAEKAEEMKQKEELTKKINS